MRLGKVVRSNNHCDYVVQVDDALEVKNPPAPDDYGFGSFVKLEDEQRHWAVGLVYNTQLLNPMFLNSGPRLSSEPDPYFSPDLQNEVRTLLSVVLIGALDEQYGYGKQGIPRVVVPINTPVFRMSQEEILGFHQDPEGKTQFSYYGLLMNNGGNFAEHLIYQVLNDITPMFVDPAQQRALQILSKELSWKMTIGAMR
ncbi:MAG: hypothetical protein Q6K80_09910 [Thermostichus sp. DG_1_6_bins_120]